MEETTATDETKELVTHENQSKTVAEKPYEESVVTEAVTDKDKSKSVFTVKEELLNSDMEDIDPGPDMRNVRRIIAEDPDYNLATVTELEARALDRIVENFAFNASMYKDLKPVHREKVLEKLNLKIPLRVVADLIEDGPYWRRRCLDCWKLCDPSHYGDSWRRLFFERNLQEIIEAFIPDKTDPVCLEETLQLSTPYIERLVITQMLPPIKIQIPPPHINTDDASDDADSDTEEAPRVDHMSLGPIVSRLPHLTELRVSYDVKNIGMNFEWNVFQFTVKDCVDLSECVAAAKSLKVFHLTRSRVDCDRCRVIISRLLDHPGLEELNLSHNHIGDRGARAIGKMLNNRSRLRHLMLTSNCIRGPGAQAIAYALSKSCQLTHLDLRLNRIMDEGGQAVCKALLINTTLTSINLAANCLSEPTAAVLTNVVQKNTTLISMDLSNNRLGPDGGKQLQEGMTSNRTMIHLDLRFTDCGDEAVFCVTQIISFNKKVRMYEQETDPEIRGVAKYIIGDLKRTILNEEPSYMSLPNNEENQGPFEPDSLKMVHSNSHSDIQFFSDKESAQ